jgi:tRNA dimethylallyltransferase
VRHREELYRRIDQRVDVMMEQGLVKEVESILAKGFSSHLKPLQSLGYRHIIQFLDGRMGMDEAVEAIKRDTRRYAKRQLTWFRGQRGMEWFHPDRLLDSDRIWRQIAGRCSAV